MYVTELGDHLRVAPQAWENLTLASYLEALSAWTGDMDGYFLNRGEPLPAEPTWALIAAMLDAAHTYE